MDEQMETESAEVVVTDLNDLLQQLHKVFEASEVNIEHVKAILESYKSNPKDWKRFAKFDQHRYTRNLVDSGNGKFNLMALCWGEQNGSSIHDHTDCHCFVKVLQGDLMETMFEWPSESGTDSEMKQTDCNVYGKDQVTYINDSMGLHRMENPSHTERTVSLHLYCPPFQTCRVFDQRTGHDSEVQVTFWSKFGMRTPFTGNGASVARRASSAAWNELPAPPPAPENN